jgi:hypothetical protein
MNIMLKNSFYSYLLTHVVIDSKMATERTYKVSAELTVKYIYKSDE